jgi:hypothetical protein
LFALKRNAANITILVMADTGNFITGSDNVGQNARVPPIPSHQLLEDGTHDVLVTLKTIVQAAVWIIGSCIGI